MKNSTLIFSLFFCIVSIGCARTVTKQPLESTATKPVLTYDQIVGTWVSGSISDKENIYSEESFLVDGTYCLVEVNTASPAHVFTYSKGTWDYNSTYEPYIGITVKSSTKPSQIAAGGASEVRLIRNYTGSSIYMGYSCPHCSGGWVRCIVGHLWNAPIKFAMLGAQLRNQGDRRENPTFKLCIRSGGPLFWLLGLKCRSQ